MILDFCHADNLLLLSLLGRQILMLIKFLVYHLSYITYVTVGWLIQLVSQSASDTVCCRSHANNSFYILIHLFLSHACSCATCVVTYTSCTL